jgi:hypothetical protein
VISDVARAVQDGLSASQDSGASKDVEHRNNGGVFREEQVALRLQLKQHYVMEHACTIH